MTGASGFIGGYLIKELIDRGYSVKGMTRRKNFKIAVAGAETVTGDITRYDDVKLAMKDVDAVFHNAAYALDWGKRKDFFLVNVQGTKNVADACLKEGVKRIVYTSSAGVYGYPKGLREIDEDTPKKPLNVYQKTKLLGEEVLGGYEELHVSIVRPPMVFGPGSPALKILFSTLKKHEMVYVGSGEQRISIAHPCDVARCLRLALERDRYGDSFNVVSFICKIKDFIEEIATQIGLSPPEKHVPYSVAYLTAIFKEFLSSNPSVTRFRAKSLGTTRVISYKKASMKLGYKPLYDFNMTVKEIVEWYKNL